MSEVKDKKEVEVKQKKEIKVKTEEKAKEKNKSKSKTEAKKEYWAVGRRKKAVARVKLVTQKKGGIVVNHQPSKSYFVLPQWQGFIEQPLIVTNFLNRYEIAVNVKSGGIAGQAGAVRQGISRVLIKMDASLRPILKKAGLLTRDARCKERKKYGQKGARAKFQFTKR